MSNRNKASIGHKLIDNLKFLKKFDAFGVKISIMHKQKNQIESRVGGCVTLWFIIAILFYFISCLNTMLNHDGDELKIGMQFYDDYQEVVYPKKQ